MRDEDEEKATMDNATDRWLIGTTYRNLGSIHSDTWKGTAASLAESNLIAIYPAIGWWKTRSHLGKYNNKIRYSLVVSLETEDKTVDLYTPIIIQIKNPVEIKIPNNTKNK